MQTLLNTPHEIIQQNILGAAAKAKTRILNILVLGMMAGSFIAMGAQSSSLAVHNISNIGLARTLAGCIFPVGLMMIVFVGGELFTGDCMMSMAWMQRKIHFADMLRTLVLVYVSNFVGAALIAFLVAHSGQYDYSFGALGAYTIKVAYGKVHLSFANALVSGILCNILVCVAVLMAAAAKDIAGKVLAIFFPILAFVVSGFEHCVANMYYIPAGIFASKNAAYAAKAFEFYNIDSTQLSSLNWGSFAISNLIPVTIGNIIGGALLVGGACFYLHGKALHES